MSYTPADLSTPATRAFAVTPNDTTQLTNGACRALYVGSTGNVKVTTKGGDDVTLTNIQDGTFVPLSCKLVWSTGTTATNIVALY